MLERDPRGVEEAVHKMSGLPAQRYGLKDRGQLAENKPADLVVFDPETVSDRSTFESPLETAVGVDWVLVNGQVVIDSGNPTDKRPGQVLRRSN